MTNVCQYEKCTGCFACANACPKNCIMLKEDEYGEIHPQIDSESCVDCGKCRLVCPYVDEKYRTLKNEIPNKCFASVRIDLSENPRCASGGIASLLMVAALERGWRVFGTAYDSEAGVIVKELIDIEKITEFQGSRYTQSYVLDSFSYIKKALREGNKVLFIGTPCQIAGLKSICKNESENLYTCDLVCHGVSPQKYLDEEISRIGIVKKNLTNVTFRGVNLKEDHWLCMWNNDRKVYAQPRGKNSYMTGFYSGFSLRSSCHNCVYTTKDRVGDMTLGDFLGMKNETSKLKKNFCTLVIVNSKKGEELLSFTDGKVIIQEKDIVEAFEGGASFKSPFPVDKNSEKFRQLYRDKGYALAMKKIAGPQLILFRLQTVTRVLRRALKK